MTYGAPSWRDWVLDEDASRPFLKRALEAGINFFDTADMYSTGVSEEILGRALKDFGSGRDTQIIATKVYLPMGKDPNTGASRASIFWPRSTPPAPGHGLCRPLPDPPLRSR